MVMLVLIVVLIGAGAWVRADFKYHYWKERCENYQALYENEQADRIDYELELLRTQTQLEDSRQAYSRLIGTKVQGWASATVTRH